MSHEEIGRVFPRHATEGFEITSPHSRKYNCIAWAAGDDSRKWDCTALLRPGFYWPAPAKFCERVDALVSVFQTLGYELCDNESLEAGFEKVALYGDSAGDWTHAAKQLADGSWTSKLGDAEDIVHATPRGVAGLLYGEVHCYVRRPIATSADYS